VEDAIAATAATTARAATTVNNAIYLRRLAIVREPGVEEAEMGMAIAAAAFPSAPLPIVR
jgi:hypothetical protein